MEPHSLAAQVTEGRERIGITQAELARRAGLSASTVNRIEMGTRVPSSVTLRAIARALGVSVDGLLDPPTPPRRSVSRPAA